MAGQIIRILPRTDFDMTGLSGGGASGVVVIARKVDTSKWRECVLLARLHAAASWPGGSTISLIAAPDGYTDEDPGAIWSFSSTTLITFTQGTDTPPAVKNANYAAPFGPLIQLQLKFALASAGGAFKPSVSVDLNLKGE